MWKVPLFDLEYDHQEIEAVVKVLESKWLSSGPRTQQFEEKFAKYLGGNVHCCAVSSCTASLHMALLLAGIKPDDEVILSGLSFVAALNMVTLVRATPVLADSKSLEDWNVSMNDIEQKITSKTKAVIVVHFAGYPCDMEELMFLVKKYGLILIEDVAHAIGAKYKGKMCGTFGDISCFSFFSNKNLSTGEGGMFVTSDSELGKKSKLFRSHGMTSMTVDRHENKAISYDVVMPGVNYRMNEITAALGLVQLGKLDQNNEKRKKIVQSYIHNLQDIETLIIPWRSIDPYIKSSYHIFPVLLPTKSIRLKIINEMRNAGIQTSIHYPSYGDFTCYQRGFSSTAIPLANMISDQVLTLPLYPGMTLEMVENVCHIFKNAIFKC